jgi:beta-hydroxylase
MSNPHDIIESIKYIIPKNKNEFLDKKIYFPDSHILENNWKIIQEECKSILDTYGSSIPEFKDIDENQTTICTSGKWRMFMLRLFNKDLPNSKKCPKTMKLINQCKGIRNAFFSILDKQSYLPEHQGGQYSIFRYHLALIIPEPDNCKLIVNGKHKKWIEGESFMFDDTFMHSAKNDSDYQRVILFLDIERNDLNIFAVILDYIINILIKYHSKYNEAIKKSEPNAILNFKK